METGKLFNSNKKLLVKVEYKLHSGTDSKWWGELVPTEYINLSNGDGYILELEDGQKGRCSLQKLINHAVSSVPPLYHYRFKGHSSLE